MSNFIELDFLEKYDLVAEMKRMEDILDWGNTEQICINTIKEKPDDHQFGTGSLYIDWKKTESGNMEWVLKDNPPSESDFTETVTMFKETLFDKILQDLKKYYDIGRVRLMRSSPKTTLTWHTDDTIRLHYPLDTYEGCFMVIGKEIQHLKAGKWYETNTLVQHTAFNASQNKRTHLVVNVVKKKIPNKIVMNGHEGMLGKVIYKNFPCDQIRSSTDKIVEQVKDYDIFINNVYSKEMQYELMKKVWEVWKYDSKKRIINIGSRAKDFIKDEYGFHKNVLSNFTKHANFNGSCRVSCINFGYLDELTEDEIIDTLTYVLSSKINIEEVTAFSTNE